ncbi:MAG TPA: asparaginase [Thermomicrobiales bacterium]|nr:asparaginase [Thermomicrobiales bacterium]
MTLPHVAILTTGGTIASLRDPETGAVRTAATPEDLLELVPDISEIAEMSAYPQAAVNSWNMSPTMMLDLITSAIAKLVNEKISGVVITHGTDTVEETAILAWMLNPTEEPIVFTAAMRNLSETGPDGPRNLRDAVRVAACPEARGRGAMLVVNETIHDARYVTKTSTVNPATFESPHGGPIGEATAVGVEFFRPPVERKALEQPRIGGTVPIVKAYTGMDAAVLDWYRDRGAEGVVIEGSGAGNVPGEVLPGIERLTAAGVPVVLTTRCISGPLAPVYGTGGASGGGHDLMRAGVIPASRFTAQKARICLMALLGSGASTSQIDAWFRSV